MKTSFTADLELEVYFAKSGLYQAEMWGWGDIALRVTGTRWEFATNSHVIVLQVVLSIPLSLLTCNGPLHPKLILTKESLHHVSSH